MLNPVLRFVAVATCALALVGCVQFKSKRGVEVAWQPEVMSGIEMFKNQFL